MKPLFNISVRLSLAAALFVPLLAPFDSMASTVRSIINVAKKGDGLDFRIAIKQLSGKSITSAEWSQLRSLILALAPEAGYDLIFAWDRGMPTDANSDIARSVQENLTNADELMLKKSYDAAFAIYQKAAKSIKVERDNPSKYGIQSSILYPYILHGMARALYGAGRFKESLEVLNWIDALYPKYRQVLFEKMWAAFRAGALDLALGAIASQRSGYLSYNIHPESYLIQLYIYKKLCRDDEARLVLEEMKKLKDDLSAKRIGLEDWVRQDVESTVLWRLTRNPGSNPARINEAKKITQQLSQRFERERKVTIENLTTAISYAQLSISGTSDFFRPIEKLPSRQGLFRMGLEIWPADSSEEWVDEVGSHRFVGESRCASNTR